MKNYIANGMPSSPCMQLSTKLTQFQNMEPGTLRELLCAERWSDVSILADNIELKAAKKMSTRPIGYWDRLYVLEPLSGTLSLTYKSSFIL